MEVHASPKWTMSTFKLSRCQDTEKRRVPPQIPFLPQVYIFYIRPHFFPISAGLFPKITPRPHFPSA